MASQLPAEFLEPSAERQLVIGFDCEGVDLCRHGTPLYHADAIYLVDAIQGGAMLIQACLVFSVWHQVEQCCRYSGISYLEKEEVRFLLRQDPNFWTYRPLSEQMVRAAADDVRFLLYIYYKMMEKLNQQSLWYLAVRGALYCRCFCINDNNFADWPPLPPIPADNLIVDGNAPEEEILSVLDVPPGKMGRVIGRRGASILSIKESCNAEILIGGDKGPPDKVFIIGPVKQVRKAEAMLRGKMMDVYY
ncbi:hypothetical protein GBA52_029136 [Prunus armeniaca]|nr:hypothetical protein GBA52_029136 [Prunus armeniaca]